MISSISPSSGVDSYSRYVQFNNNGYLIDETLNSVQSDRLQRVTKQITELGNKMGASDVDVNYSIGTESIATRNNWCSDASQKMTNGVRLSTSADDSDSSESFKTGTDQLQATACGKSDEEKPMPDHHARRPMNAFLIFCKRHRGIVRERYPNLENRAITKILGDWWANLNVTEKSSYTNLAKEYKDAFFNANPDFKWYKLPAPPLRTGYQRMASDRHSSFSEPYNFSDFDLQPPKIKCKRYEGSGVGTFFKLADEAQMGSLSSLMVSSEINGKCANNNNKFMANNMEVDEEKDDEKDGDISDSKDELHRVLGETNSFLQNTMKGYEHLDEYPFENNATNNDIPQKLLHSQMSSSSPEMKHFELDSPDDDHNPYDSVFGSKKSSRACKGKRYMEFMNAQKLNPIGKRTKPRTTSTSSSTSLSPTQPLHVRSLKKSLSCSQAVQKLDYDTFDHLYANNSATILSSTTAIKNETEAVDKSAANKNEMLVSPSDSRKFDVTEFELEQKINALTAHNLDEYLVRKQDTKKKKKPSDKRSGGGYRKVHKVGKAKVKSLPAVHAIVAPKTFEEARLAMVGSQKRKARKESITRRDVQQVTAIVQSYSPTLDPHFVPMLTTPFGSNASSSNTIRCGNSGLLMLATMAEVAAANYAV
ncbi:uncharacterized protein LOC129580386 [Sitodiplosis mosellana]|uniref:uncharacterized protein LOC129580386 n=1 Tax=Sitodiplosis mosellana TaxID=263140 RepID=UPI002443F0E1|nr:uncharacterized protein LOC129580386 [Sitodiplosis mosellana]XP_055326708.1 uncharacterized protein LOC129580386 [Sitodiplosis mosellana]XP_055326709.1 uncharacterized protein LOC129580386 [Sitodiplosis mosellana]XP_055326710.1 uncharacterized protein LOC129580386 [Sitodiplosis mosellana]XP_055326711.1 uncharacterized protein LOC129580386 [Sitodiplosis mosellana]XP_055326712.1 uncharacterized protein LOC129580386 [Sitodiplosis mosellana]XP_055326713.1 uncharacterized protein LOC129580386 [